MINRLLGIVLTLAIVLGLLLAGNLYWFGETPYGEETITLTIDKGTPLKKIAGQLEAEGVISSAWLFRLYLYARGEAGRLRAGEYVFPPQLTPDSVLALLIKGDFKRYRITIPEGWSLKEIGNYLAGLGFTTFADFETRTRDPVLLQKLKVPSSSLEGYLFPSTYEFYRPRNVDEILEKLTAQFFKVWTPEMGTRATELGMTQQQIVTLASLIEKETAQPEERPLISSVFHNRLRLGIALATDPAVIYGIPHFNGNLTRKDLETPGPYNTYMNPGLPPTPIASPGEASLKAALWPAQTEFLYFVSRNDGTHQFSTNLQDHNTAVNRYQR